MTRPGRRALHPGGTPLLGGVLTTGLVLTAALLAGCRAGEPVAAPPTSSVGTAPGATRTTTTGATPSPARPVFPVRSTAVHFGRVHHDYPATDIFAPCGSAALAPVDGRIAEVSRSDTWSARRDDGATRGGLSYSLVGVDGVRYYGSHLTSLRTGIAPGRAVRAGEVLGRVGHTGSARPTACHLHFGISPPCATGDWWNRRGVVPPYPYLTSWRRGGARSPVRAVAGWRAKHGCPKKP
jgi:peptidoglycan LD-endopeptidase LytH